MFGVVKEPRALLRAILREATYLPDEHARAFVTKHAISRFREYAPGSKKQSVVDARLEDKITEARQAFHRLRRANDGAIKDLQHVLLLSYGRKGKRRHELSRPLLKADPGKDEQDGLTDQTAIEIQKAMGRWREIQDRRSNRQFRLRQRMLKSKPTRSDSKSATRTAERPTMVETTGLPELVNPLSINSSVPTMSAMLRALLVSQVQSAPRPMTRTNPRITGENPLEPVVPEVNDWMRPMPTSRAVNTIKRWYAETLERVLPPLPTKEWEQLRDRAIGTLRYKPRSERRKPAQLSIAEVSQGPEQSLDGSDLAWQSAMPPNLVPRTHSGERQITKRYMQRRWAEIFSQCPRMDWDNEFRRWNVIWGADVLRDSKRSALEVTTE